MFSISIQKPFTFGTVAVQVRTPCVCICVVVILIKSTLNGNGNSNAAILVPMAPAAACALHLLHLGEILDRILDLIDKSDNNSMHSQKKLQQKKYNHDFTSKSKSGLNLSQYGFDVHLCTTRCKFLARVPCSLQ